VRRGSPGTAVRSKHEVAARRVREDSGVDAVRPAREGREAVHFLRIGELDRPAGELEGVVDEAGAVHRLNDAEHLALAEALGEVAGDVSQPVRVRRPGRLLEDRAAVVHHTDVEPRPA